MISPTKNQNRMPTRILNIRFIKFLAVGVINTIFGYGLFSLFIWLGLHYSIAIGLATILGVLFNFKTIGGLVFASHDNAKIFKFMMVYAIVYMVNVVGMYAMLKIESNAYISGAVLLLPLAVLSYILNSKFVFNKSI